MQFGQKGILKLAKRPSRFGEAFRGVSFGYVNNTLCE
jgi:hypothetical protein